MSRLHLATAVALAATVSACAAPMPTGPAAVPTLRLDAPASAETVARAQVYDWSSDVVTGKRLGQLRLEARAQADLAPARKLLALTASLDLPGAGFAGSAATGRISAPAYDAARDRIYWLAENGWLLRRDRATGTDAAFPISATDGPTPTDSFPETQITLSKDGKRVYLCAASGKLYALDADSGQNLMNSPWELGETSADVGYVPAPCVDPVASRADGQVETVYAVTNKATVYRFVVDGSGESLPPYMQKVETYALAGQGYRNRGEVGELDRCRVSPVAIGGFVFLQVTRPEAGSVGNRITYIGRHVFLDSHATTPTLAPTAGAVLMAIQGANYVAGTQPATVVVDDQLLPRFLFNPDHQRVNMYNVRPASMATGFSYFGRSTYLSRAGAAWPAEGKIVDNQIGEEFRGTRGGVPSAVAVDPANERVFTLTHNVLMQLGYQEDPALDPGEGAEFDDYFYTRSESFGTVFRNLSPKHSYAKTTLGRSESMLASPTTMLDNPVPPYFDGTHVWAIDNFPRGDGTSKLTLNKFLPGADGPTLVEALDLGSLAPSATTLDGRLTRVPGGPILLTTAGASPRLFGFQP